MLKHCLQCKRRFETQRRHAKTCSTRCRVALLRAIRAEQQRHEWYSPAEVVGAAREVMGGIDLDPASSPIANKSVGAATYYTVRDNGLTRPWFGRLWMNPPYGRQGPRFVRRFVEEFTAGRVEQGVLLLGVHHTFTRWAQPLRALAPIRCEPPGRLRFTNERGELGNPEHASVVLGIGVDRDLFRVAFEPLGEIVGGLSAAA